MRKTILTSCPVCSNNLIVKKLECSSCKTIIEGNFGLSKFNYLEKEKLYFIEVFIKNRGNIKAIEKELNISYPTVKKLLDDVIIGLGYTLTETDEFEKEYFNRPSNKDLLEAIKHGKITVEEALKQMK